MGMSESVRYALKLDIKDADVMSDESVCCVVGMCVKIDTTHEIQLPTAYQSTSSQIKPTLFPSISGDVMLR